MHDPQSSCYLQLTGNPENQALDILFDIFCAVRQHNCNFLHHLEIPVEMNSCLSTFHM